ncbi:MAG: YciI family protein [Solirubrobacterales bacterium]
MKFMVSLITDGTYMEQATREQRKEMGGRMMEFMGELRDAGVLVDPGGALAPSADARTLRYGTDGEVVVTDGPFAESKEQMAGYMILECKDLDEALGWLRRMPVRRSSVELRPIRDPAGGGEAEKS